MATAARVAAVADYLRVIDVVLSLRVLCALSAHHPWCANRLGHCVALNQHGRRSIGQRIRIP